MEQVYSPRLSEIAAGGTVANGRQIERKISTQKRQTEGNDISEKRVGGKRKQENWMRESRQTIRRSAGDLQGARVFTARERGGGGRRWNSSRWRDLIGRGGKYDSA